MCILLMFIHPSCFFLSTSLSWLVCGLLLLKTHMWMMMIQKVVVDHQANRRQNEKEKKATMVLSVSLQNFVKLRYKTRKWDLQCVLYNLG